jgi:hypothetical protein
VERKAAVAVANKEYEIIINELNGLLNVDRTMRVAMSSLLAAQKRRIFQEGQAANESKIGTYSKKKISISRKNQAKDTGHTYFKGGYSQYKSEIGRNPGYVNLRNTDQMMMDYGVFVLGNNEYGLGFNNDLNFDKTQWMEEKYNKDIFDEATREGEMVENIILLEVDRLMK